ncbi:hypothetical protein N8865_01375 [Francisellaceae bacterium]|nr:hypothetical protein [Francisellaceae bacterium]
MNMMVVRQIFQQKNINTLGFIFLLGMFAFVPVSIAPVNIFGALALLCFLLCGDWKEKGRLCSHPLVILFFALYLISLLGAIHSDGSWADIVYRLKQNRKFLYPIFILYFISTERRQKYALIAVCVGIVADLAAIYLNDFILGVAHAIKFSGGAMFPSPQNHFVTAFAFILLGFSCFAVFFKTENKWRWLWLLLGVLAFIAEMGINQARTGYLIEFCIVFVFFCHRYGFKGLIRACLVVALLFGSFYVLSPDFKGRINLGVHQVAQYSSSVKPDDLNGNSIGLRLAFYELSAGMWVKGDAEEKLLGYGTGSLPVVSQKYLQTLRAKEPVPREAKIPGSKLTDPESQYFFYLVEHGLLGVLYFAAMMLGLYWMTRRLEGFYRDIGRITIIAMGVGCFFNSWMQTFSISHLLIVVLGIAFFCREGVNRPDG